MIGVVRDDTESAVRGYVEDEGVPYMVAFDPGGRAALDFGTRGQPETYAITPDGVIAGSKWGPSSVAELEQMYRAAGGTA
jgi:cytochrome c biogenesis protein CcmG, thiol:disulfide interchange protein DsbE